MKYIEEEDLYTIIQKAMLLSSLENDLKKIDTIELMIIDEVKAYLSPIYRTDKIFNDPPLRDGLLVRIIAVLAIYRAIRRNAARKVPEDYEALKGWADDMLSKISTGVLKLSENIPLTTKEDGSLPSMFGSNRKEEYYF